MTKHVVLGLLAVGLLAFTTTLALADSDYEYGKQMAKLVKAMPQAKVTLDQGIKTAAAGGKAISAQYEVDEDAGFQLSVFVSKGGGAADVHEVIVNYTTGAIKSDDKLTDPDDVTDAGHQLAALAKAKTSLEQAVEAVLKANPGYTAIRVYPKLSGGSAVAAITLLKDGKTKKLTQKLD
ncbi:MAG: hypothetical protein KGL11_07080 [Alphaproteobacteria bacterium]|nr:hypothetical protein [Alphaproteobacteria bacterium]